MIIKEISKEKFDEYASNHILKSFYQSSNYGDLMENYKYKAIYIGGIYDGKIIAAALILYKYIATTIKYGYSPRGFLIDYYDEKLLKEFTEKISYYFLLRNFAFIKINPEIILSKIDYVNNKKIINHSSRNLCECMMNLKYEKLKDNLYFESMLPKYAPVINLNKFSTESLDNDILDKISSKNTQQYEVKKCNVKDLDTLYKFIKEKSNKTLKYYQELYETYNEDNSIDLLMVKIDYTKELEICQTKLNNIIIENEKINDLFNDNPTDNELYKNKVNSDNLLNEINHKIESLTNKIRNGILNEYVGGSLLIKYANRVNLIISGFSNDIADLNIKYFLYCNFIEYYKNLNYTYLDLNGISGNFTDNNPYKSLNNFKLSFNPSVYEYIGEFDLVVNNAFYNLLWSGGKLEKEFNS